MKIEVDVGGALKKTAALKAMPKARRHIVHQWATDTTMMLKRRAASMKKSEVKTSKLMRSIDLVERTSGEIQTIIIGTNVKKQTDVKYAEIQDKGGTIRAKKASFTIQNIAGKPHLGPYLTIPLPGTKEHRMKDYPGAFVIRSKKGNLLVVQQKWKKVRGGEDYRRVGANAEMGESGLVPLFVLKFSVDIPATRWFSGITGPRLHDLDEMMKTEYVMKVAAGMGGVG